MTTDTKTSKIYIGQHQVQSKTTYDNWYFGGGKIIKEIIKSGGRDRLTRDTLAECDNQQDADILEKFFISVYNSESPAVGYNRSSGGKYNHKSNHRWLQENDKVGWAQVRKKMCENGKKSPTKFQKGYKLSKISIDKMRKNMPKKYKSVKSLTTGIEYPSLQSAAKELNKKNNIRVVGLFSWKKKELVRAEMGMGKVKGIEVCR